MSSKFFPLLLVLFLFTLKAFPSPIKNVWEVGTHAHWIDDDLLRFRIVSLTMSSQFEYELNPGLNFLADIDFSLELGDATGAYSNVLVPERGIYLRELLLRKYFGNFHLGIGAINQELFSSAILFHHSVFFGLYEKLLLSSKSWDLYLLAQQSVPSAVDFSPDAVTKQTTPLFYSYMAGLERKQSNIQFGANLAYFYFNDPSRSMAHNSRFLGSTVTGTGLVGAKFVYDYSGWIARGKVGFQVKPLVFSLDTHFVQNREAPGDKGNGWLLGLGLGYEKRNIEFSLRSQLVSFRK